MPTLNDFLELGFFPQELPPAFATVLFASAVAKHGPLPNDDPKTAKLCLHNLSRPGSLRRKLAIPNPVHYHRLADAITSNWNDIAAHIDRSSLSVSKPTGNKSIRAVVPGDMFVEMEARRHQLRALARYVVQADINQFYGSLYTHSLPWALHTKPVAKSRRNDPSLLGNVLDRCARNMQDGQTVGIPIGPDTSLVLAEIVLSACDQDMVRRVPGLRAFRQIDDIEMSAVDRSEGESFLGRLQQSLSDYELNLNPKKTRIVEQPSPFAAGWLHDVRRFRFRNGATSQKFDLLAFYDLVLREAAAHGEESVMKYAVSRMRAIQIHPDNWHIHERFLYQAVLIEPGVMPEAISQLLRFQAMGLVADMESLATVVDRQIIRHAPQGHGNDVAWAVWTALAFRLSMTPDAMNAAIAMNDSVVALLLLDAEAQGLLPAAIAAECWQDFMSTEELYGEHWLLSYESRLKGWRKSKDVDDHIAADPNWTWIRSHDVSFYTPVSSPVPPPVRAVAELKLSSGNGSSPAYY